MGVAVSRYQFLTAAHCFNYKEKSSLFAIANIKEAKAFDTHPKDWGYPWFTIKSVVNHNGYHYDNWVNDLAIVTINPSEKIGYHFMLLPRSDQLFMDVESKKIPYYYRYLSIAQLFALLIALIQKSVSRRLTC